MIIELLKRQKKDKNIASFWCYNFDKKKLKSIIASEKGSINASHFSDAKMIP